MRSFRPNLMNARGFRLTRKFIFPLLCFLAAASACTAQTDFDQRNQKGLRRNPHGVKFVLKTKEIRSAHHLFETIPIEFAFTSSRPSVASIELLETMNAAGGPLRLDVESETQVSLTLAQFQGMGFGCCISRWVYRSDQPIIFERELTDYLRFEKPGIYRRFLTTWRVCKEPRSDSSSGHMPSKMAVTSSIFTGKTGWSTICIAIPGQFGFFACLATVRTSLPCRRTILCFRERYVKRILRRRVWG